MRCNNKSTQLNFNILSCFYFVLNIDCDVYIIIIYKVLCSNDLKDRNIEERHCLSVFVMRAMIEKNNLFKDTDFVM